MSTLVVVKKNGKACIAADTLTSFGSNKQLSTYVVNPEKIYRVGDSYLGMVGSAAHDLVMASIFGQLRKVPTFQTRLEIFEFFRSLHPRLKEEYFLNPKDEEDDPYESSQLEICIANRYGIFSVFSLREVDEYTKFWAMGSGSEYALGAMYAVYESLESAEEIATIGVKAGIEFDDGSAAPVTSYSVELLKI
jgi:ATP-dependent protease HslVU (ClpYQ) peptidase subunit